MEEEEEEEEGERGQSGPLGAVGLSMKESRGPPHLSQRGTKLYSRPNTMQTNTLPFTAVILYHDHRERWSLIGQFERSWTHPCRVCLCVLIKCPVLYCYLAHAIWAQIAR